MSVWGSQQLSQGQGPESVRKVWSVHRAGHWVPTAAIRDCTGQALGIAPKCKSRQQGKQEQKWRRLLTHSNKGK